MNPRTIVPLIVIVASLGLSASGLLSGQVVDQGPNITVFFTGDQNGEVASCGCPKEDYGGVTRRAAFFDTLRTSGWDFLTVDGGDIAPFDKRGSQTRLKMETMAKAMATMGYQAVTLGDHDLAEGSEFMTRMVKWLGQPVLATNYDLPEGLSERARVVTVRGRRVGIVAFLDPKLVENIDWITVEPWEEQRARVEALRAESDLLVALLHAPDRRAVTRFIELYPDVDLVLPAHEGMHALPIYEEGTTYVVGSAGRGRYLARVEIAFTPDGELGKMDSAYLPVVEGWGRRAKVDAMLEDYYKEMRALVASDAFRRERLASLREPPIEFVGNAGCVSCHEPEAAQYRTTLHAHAKETLVGVESDRDPDCQPCHTTGFGFRTGFAAPEETPEMWNVGCESCHGAGAAHVAAPEEPYGAIDESVCLKCHTEDNSPDFDYATYRPNIVHAAGEGPSGAGSGH